MSNPGPNPPKPNEPTPAPAPKSQKAARVAADYKKLSKAMDDACTQVIAAIKPLCLSDKDANDRDLLPPTDMLGLLIYNDVATYKSSYKADMTVYTGSSPRKTKADAIRASMVDVRSKMIKSLEAAKKAQADLKEAQLILETQRKLYKSNNKTKMEAKLKAKKDQETRLAEQRAKLEKELAED